MSASKRTDAKDTRFNQRRSGDDLKTQDGRWRPEVLADVVRRLGESGASPDFDHLVGLGCRRDVLLDFLVWIGPCAQIEDSQAALTGYPRSKLKTVLNRMRKCADEVEVLVSLGHTNSLLSGRLSFPLSKEVLWIPADLRLYADYIESIMRVPSLHPRSHLTRNIAVSNLVMAVKTTTGRFHDREVSALISAVLDRPNYDELAHRQWRSEHSDLLSAWMHGEGKKFYERWLLYLQTPSTVPAMPSGFALTARTER
jgi:hypothetical protein